MINNNFWLYMIFIVLCLIFGIIMGYIYHGMVIEKTIGISFDCNKYISNYFNRDGCNANITLPNVNATILVKSDFDSIKIIS